ncbi:MAG: hypothetical protein J6Q55_02080 [Clostridia bacterium]|nr:hypothetical protein [Clostridia bacterium]
MSSNQLAEFTSGVNNLIESKLILVDKNIATVLKCVATTPVLCKCLADTIQTTSYATEFSRAKVSWTTTEGRVINQLKLPVDRNRLFSFVVCLLTEVDSGRRNFLDFLKEYYHPTDSNLGYEKFADEVLKPFKQAGVSLLANVDPESLNGENTARAEKFFAAEKMYIESALLKDIFQQIEQINIKVHCEDFSPAVVEEISVLCEYFSNALYLKNPKILWVVWIAFKRTVNKYPQLDSFLSSINKSINVIFS